METVLILGATSSIARAIADRYAAEGRRLIMAARNEDELERLAADLRIRHAVPVVALRFEATDTESHAPFWQRCLEEAGTDPIGVVLCFGAMAEQAAAQTDFTQARQTLEGSFIGAVSILNRVAEDLERRKTGFIAVLSSVAGDRGRQSNYIYGAAKAGLNVYLQGLRQRLHPAGVPVTTIKPGFVDTAMTYGLAGLFLVASPEAAARAIVRAITRRRAGVYVPWFWRGIMLLIRAIPESLFKRLKL